ncbi:MAG: SufS family cysteine desulfurase, partial [Vicinamibacterales bacterium]|nr:SufS family cysteine desulfurase [Vicinamibacterales bacterium]
MSSGTQTSAVVRDATGASFDVERVRRDFPALHQKVHGRDLVYLDSAATSQKPQSVIDAVSRYYAQDNANVHRGLHALSERATASYESARQKVCRFVHAAEAHEIIFVHGATDGINLVAQSYGRSHLQSGDEVLITHMEHHSNIVPWQIVCEQTGAVLRVAPIDERGELVLDEYESLLTDRTRIVAASHVSNALGTINPVERMVELAHGAGAIVLLDGAQAVAHSPVDVQALGCDAYVLSGHKMFGPTGVGVLYGKTSLLEQMPPYQTGGDMIKSVSFETTTYNDLPYRFEAGTPNIAGVVGLGAAVDYLEVLDRTAAQRHEDALLEAATEGLSQVAGLRQVGTAARKAAVVSFVLDDVHPHDIGTILDGMGIAIRTGHHCAQPVMEHFDVPA